MLGARRGLGHDRPSVSPPVPRVLVDYHRLVGEWEDTIPPCPTCQRKDGAVLDEPDQPYLTWLCRCGQLGRLPREDSDWRRYVREFGRSQATLPGLLTGVRADSPVRVVLVPEVVEDLILHDSAY